MAAFTLIAQTPDLLVLDKPAGLLCVPGRGPDKQDCLSARVQAVYPQARVVHRLDMATSGLVLMALHAQAQRQLSWAFAQRLCDKRYQAIVHGHLPIDPHAVHEDPHTWALIDAPIAADWPRRPLRVVAAHGQPSQTRWRALAHLQLQGQPCTRVDLAPLSGRTHQLRVHLQSLGHPIVGDALYGPLAHEHSTALAPTPPSALPYPKAHTAHTAQTGHTAHGADLGTHASSGRLLLHAYSLRVPWPSPEPGGKGQDMGQAQWGRWHSPVLF